MNTIINLKNLKMSKPEIEIIEPNYEGLAKVIDSLKDLYQMNGITSSMIETCFRHLMQPPTILHNNPNGENLSPREEQIKPWEEITKDDINHLYWIFNRIEILEKKLDQSPTVLNTDNLDYMIRFREIIKKINYKWKIA